MIAFVMFWGLFAGFMGAKTIDYNDCLKNGHPKQYCYDHYSYENTGHKQP